MSKKLVYSKESPLFVDENSDFQNISFTSQIQFKCQKCGKLFSRGFRNNPKLLCRVCKTEEYCLEKYGVPWTAKIPSAIEKGKQTLEKNGGYTFQRKSSTQKVKETMIERYGVSHPMESQEIKEKVRVTNNERYGGNTPMASAEVKEKVKNSTLSHFGTLSHSLDVAKSKNLEKFGVENPFYCEEVRRQKWYQYGDEKFDSKWELEYYIFKKDHGDLISRNKTEFFTYLQNGKERKYFPDFKVNGEFVEIKGDHFFTENKPIDIFGNDWSDKYNCMKENKVNILTYSDIKECENYVLSKYGKEFISNLQVLK